MRSHQEAHESREILFCISGEHFYGFRDKVWRITPGTVLLLEKRDRHDSGYSPHQPICRDLWIHFLNPQSISATNPEVVHKIHMNEAGVASGGSRGPENQVFYHISTARLFTDPVALAWNYHEKDPGNPLKLFQLKSVVTAMLLEIILRGTKPSNSPEKASRQKMIVEDIKAYIQSHLGADLSLRTLAQMADYEPVYFHRLFSRFTGESIHKFINSQRLDEAKELLREGTKISQIGDRLGYARASNFIRFFRRETGVSPTSWLKLQRTLPGRPSRGPGLPGNSAVADATESAVQHR